MQNMLLSFCCSKPEVYLSLHQPKPKPSPAPSLQLIHGLWGDGLNADVGRQPRDPGTGGLIPGYFALM